MRHLSVWFYLVSVLFSASVSAETLTLWNAHSLEHLQPELEAFSRLTGHKVQQQHFRADRIRDQVLAAAVLPDLYFIPSDQISNVQEYHLAPWPEAIPRMRQLRTDGMLGQAWYGLPINLGNHLVMYFRKDKVKPIDDVENIPAGRLGWPRDQAYWFVAFLTAAGGWPFDGDQLKLDTPAMVSALTTYKDLYVRHPASACSLMCNEQKLVEGEIDYVLDGDWAYQMLHQTLGDKLGLAMLPTLHGQVMHPLSSSYVLARTDNMSPAKRQATEELARFLLSDDSQARMYLHSMLLPAVPMVAERMQGQMSPDMQVMSRQLLQSKPMPNSRKMMLFWLVMGKGLDLLVNEEFTANEVAAKMQSMVQQEQVLHP